MFKKILIANRGEIACRIIRTCRKLGVRTVAIYSDADARAQHVRLADEAYYVGGSRPAESYLLGDVILDVAKRSGAEAIHPGYGFLSENAHFVESVERAELVFIGPRADSMLKIGSKAGAKELMQAHGVPVVPGYNGEDQSLEVLIREAERIGFPLMIKAAHGGGGKGMRVVHVMSEFSAALESCQREARNAFGRDRVLLERYIERPRHIEFQIFGDSFGNIIHLNERECSVQRRYQKVLEETPSPFLTPELRQQMGKAATKAARAIDYVNAGTVEFIVGQSGDFYFMEVNTRLQVEHPVTEMTLGLDLVELQLRVAAGEALPDSLVRDIPLTANGHAIELRLYAEDPEQNFLPGSGKLEHLHLPQRSRHVRIDSGVIEGDTVSIFYDPMIAKLIVWDRKRELALARMREALAETEIIGTKSNVEFLEQLIKHEAVVRGTIDTGYLDRHLDEFLYPQSELDINLYLSAASTALLLHEETVSKNTATASSDPYSPWNFSDAWRSGHHGNRLVCLGYRDERYELAAYGVQGNYKFEQNEQRCRVTNALLQDDGLTASFDQVAYRFRVLFTDSTILIHDGERRIHFGRMSAFAYKKTAEKNTNKLTSPMPGRIVVVKVKSGDTISEGQELLVMEAMKMEISLKAPHDAVIETVQAQQGEFVEADAVLVKLV